MRIDGGGMARATPACGGRPGHVEHDRLRRWGVWGGFALVLALAPLVFPSDAAVTMLSQMGIAIVACLSFNILLGQGGMLSFGHAVYTGLGSYAAIHALRATGHGALPLPVSLVPLAGGAAGLVAAALLGFVTTRRAGTTFAMITLGIGELVFAASLMFTPFFGGEAGVSANRVVGPPLLGISYGPQRQVYGLIAVYTFACTAAMFAFTRTPLGRMLEAVRDNAERVAFIGYDPRRVRYLGFVVAGFFAGIAGGLAALNFEIATPEVLGLERSGSILLFTVLGGSAVFFGPMLGGVLMVVALTLLSGWTPAWLLYLGLAFIVAVMYAPGGVAGLVTAALRALAGGGRRAVWRGAVLAACATVPLAGGVVLVELAYRLQADASANMRLDLPGLVLDSRSAAAWAGAAFVVVAGLALLEAVRRCLVGSRRAADAQGGAEAS